MNCAWIYDTDDLMISYHDEEWGKPLHDERKLFELLCLESMQAGLSWRIVLRKRIAFRQSFDEFDVDKIAKYTENDIQNLIENGNIIRNKKKIEAIINNAKIVKKMHDNGETLEDFFWKIIHNKPIINNFKVPEEVPTQTELSQKIAKALKKMGFKFVGPTIIYAFMEASGMVNDHLLGCYARN